MHGSGRLVAYIIFLSIHYPAAQAMVSSVSSTCQETEHRVEYTLPPAITLQECAQRKIVDMLSSGDFEEGLKLAQDVQSMRFYEKNIKVAFINEHLIAYYNSLFDQKLTTHHLSYYTTAERSGLPRSGTFVLGEAGFVVLAWKSAGIADQELNVASKEVAPDRELYTATLDLWMLEDVIDSCKEKKPRHSMFISLGEDEASAWIPAMRIKRRCTKPIDQEIIDNRSFNQTSREAYRWAVMSSNRFLLWTPKLVQVWTVTDGDELMHEATLEFAARYNDISLSPDGSKITIKPSDKDELIISLDMLFKENEGNVATVTSDIPLKEGCVASPPFKVALWSHCGKYLASTSSQVVGKIMLWKIARDVPERHLCMKFPVAFQERISFALGSRGRFITYLTSKNNHPPLTLHLFDTTQETSNPLYQASSPQSTKQYQFHELQMSDDERYCLISVSQNHPVLVDLRKNTSLTLDSKPKECSSEAHMNTITLNSAVVSCSNRYVLSINSNIAQIICLHSPFSSLTLVQLFLLQRILGTETPDTKKKALRLFASTIEDIKGEKAQLTKILQALDKQKWVPQQ